MEIVKIQAVNVRLPRLEPRTPPRRQSWREYAPIGLPMNKYPEFPPDLPRKTPGLGGRPVWVKVTAADGTWGLGRTSFGEPVDALIDYFYSPLLVGIGGGGWAGVFVIENYFAPLLINADPLDIQQLWELMYRVTFRYGQAGIVLMAMSGIDLALWDLKGKAMGQPVWKLPGYCP